MKIKSCERIMMAINHRETDKIPIDFGGTSVTGISVLAYKRLLNKLGIKEDIKVFDVMQQIAIVSDDVKIRFKSDVDILYRPRPRFNIPIYKNWYKIRMQKDLECFVPEDFTPIEDNDELIIKQGSITLAKKVKGSSWFNEIYHPLSDINDIEGLRTYKLPHYSSEDLQYLSTMSKKTRGNSNRAITGTIGKEIASSLFESGQALRGTEKFLMDMLINESYTSYLLDLLLENFKKNFDLFYNVVGENIDILKLTDDLGSQENLIISPDTFRAVFKPRLKEMIKYVKKKSNYKIFFHSDGAIYSIIPDLIEIGVDILNPVQVTARGMDINKIKKIFGKDITLWGAVIDNQRLMTMSLQEIEDQIKRRVEILAPGGGFVFSTVHNILEETSPEKIIKIFDTINNLI